MKFIKSKSDKEIVINKCFIYMRPTLKHLSSIYSSVKRGSKTKKNCPDYIMIGLSGNVKLRENNGQERNYAGFVHLEARFNFKKTFETSLYIITNGLAKTEPKLFTYVG